MMVQRWLFVFLVGLFLIFPPTVKGGRGGQSEVDPEEATAWCQRMENHLTHPDFILHKEQTVKDALKVVSSEQGLRHWIEGSLWKWSPHGAGHICRAIVLSQLVEIASRGKREEFVQMYSKIEHILRSYEIRIPRRLSYQAVHLAFLLMEREASQQEWAIENARRFHERPLKAKDSLSIFKTLALLSAKEESRQWLALFRGELWAAGPQNDALVGTIALLFRRLPVIPDGQEDFNNGPSARARLCGRTPLLQERGHPD